MATGVVDPEFWRGRRVLVTGHTGFKGSWLSLWLSTLGAKVFGFAMAPPTSPNMFERAGLAGVVEDRRGDVRDFAAVEAVLSEVRPDTVMHLAAQPVLRYSYIDPLLTISTNVMGTAHVLEAIRQYNLRCRSRRQLGIKSTVIVTSDKCYENREWVWGYRENEPMGGHDPYSASKGCAELLVSAFGRSFTELNIASARAGNVIGGGDWAKDRIVPDAVRAFSASRMLEVRSPNAIRPWQHVLEPLSGYLLLAEHMEAANASVSEGWNFGPAADNEQSVVRLVNRLVELWQGGANWRDTSGDSLHEAKYLTLDSAKARTRLGWKPHLDFNDTLNLTVRWYQEDLRLNSSSMRGFTIGQIRDYSSVK